MGWQTPFSLVEEPRQPTGRRTGRGGAVIEEVAPRREKFKRFRAAAATALIVRNPNFTPWGPPIFGASPGDIYGKTRVNRLAYVSLNFQAFGGRGAFVGAGGRSLARLSLRSGLTNQGTQCSRQ